MALNDYLNEKPVIDTGRLRLRPFTLQDVPSLRTWIMEKSIYKYWGKGPGKTDRNPELLFEKNPKPVRSFHLGIEEKDSGNVIGEIWIYRIENNRMAVPAIRLVPSAQGKGYGSEALRAMTHFCFENTELKRLQAEADVRNIASQKILEKCGFRREGLIRQGKLVSTWCDYYIYGLLRSDLAEAE